ncbi:MAG TPA: penicillin acylase family protein [Euzebyales bacterium]|nr:penicillin acylase family protein [Euzebyales bacterium]
MKRRRAVLTVLAVLLLAALLAASVAALVAVRRPWPVTDGAIELDVLRRPVDVRRDGFGVPHIYADTVEDLFAAQGFVHAQDRFWEMDVRRHTTAGRLSELFGAGQLDTDRVIRTMGWRRVAEQELALLSPESVRILEAYSSGVNAYLRDRGTSSIALEYTILGLQRPGYAPEPWTPGDSLAWLKAIAWDLRGNTPAEADRVAYTETLSPPEVEQLWPPFPFDLREPIVSDPPASAAADGTPPPATIGDDRVRRLVTAAADATALPQLLGPSGTGIGSNSMAVAGDRTASGRPLLANDPHLAPGQPSIWHQMALHCRTVSPACPYTVTGFSFSGLPGIVIGHNARIAWGLTNLGPDVADFVLERVTDDTYEYQGRSVAMEVRTETIRVAGGDDVDLRVRSTRHGPLLSDGLDSLDDVASRAPAGEGQPDLAVALRWTALEPGTTFDALPALNAAADWNDFRAAAASFDVPAQNLVYADVNGTIGYQAPGRIPIRAPGDDGRWPVPGWDGAHEWRGFVAFEDLPSVRNPDEGFVVTANQPVVRAGAGPSLSRDHAYGWRSQRLRDLLIGADDLTPPDLLAMQFDARNGLAPTLVPLLTAVDVPQDVAAARDLFVGWDHQQTADSAAGAYFAAVWRHLLLRTFRDDLPDDAVIDGGGRWMEVVRRLVATPTASWWDDRATPRVEARDDMLREALVDAHAELADRLGEELEAWRWGDVHTLTLRHPTLGSSGVAPIEAVFNRGPVGVGGGPSIVNATAWTASAGYEVDWVPSMRMVVDLGDLDASRWIDLTGISGHPYHRHYGDQTELWRTGATLPMRWDAGSVREAAVDRMVLVPSGSPPS